MLIPSTITARRTGRYTSTLYIPGTIHRLDFEPMNDGGRYNIQPPKVSNLSAHVAQYISAFYTPAEVYQNGQEGKKVAAQEVGLPSDVVKPSVGVGDSLNLALGLS